MSTHAPLSNATAQDSVTARDLSGTVATMARSLHWAVLDLHATNPGQPSRPTLELIPSAGPTVYVYVKTDGNPGLTDKQREWADFLSDDGRDVVTVTPKGLDEFWRDLQERTHG